MRPRERFKLKNNALGIYKIILTTYLQCTKIGKSSEREGHWRDKMPKGDETQEVHWKNTGKTTGYKQFDFPATLLPSLFFSVLRASERSFEILPMVDRHAECLL